MKAHWCLYSHAGPGAMLQACWFFWRRDSRTPGGSSNTCTDAYRVCMPKSGKENQPSTRCHCRFFSVSRQREMLKNVNKCQEFPDLSWFFRAAALCCLSYLSWLCPHQRWSLGVVAMQSHGMQAVMSSPASLPSRAALRDRKHSVLGQTSCSTWLYSDQYL